MSDYYTDSGEPDVWEEVEELVENVIRAYGWGTRPVRQIKTGTAPMIEKDNGDNIVVPDTKASNNGIEVWVETKQKTKPVFYRKKGVYQHGVDTRKWGDYEQIPLETGDRCYIFIYEEKSGHLLRKCTQCLMVDHQHDSGGSNGEAMTYFDRDEFDKVPVSEEMSVDGLNPQTDLDKETAEINFQLFPHEEDSAKGNTKTLSDY